MSLGICALLERLAAKGMGKQHFFEGKPSTWFVILGSLCKVSDSIGNAHLWRKFSWKG